MEEVMPKYIVAKEFYFDAAHKLPGEEIYGKCANLHGHTYKLIVKVQGEVNANDHMVINFDIIKGIVKKEVIDKFDHQFLNDYFLFPTGEVIADYIYDVLNYKIKMLNDVGKDKRDKLTLHSIILYETPTSFVEILNDKA
jgi:6-pyruvoyltetrahydropterin/6-carboxytetrahydropterin synthase